MPTTEVHLGHKLTGPKIEEEEHLYILCIYVFLHVSAKLWPLTGKPTLGVTKYLTYGADNPSTACLVLIYI
jgi:hypothetical protein